MPEKTPPDRAFRFDEFVLLADQRMLTRAGRRVHLTPRLFHLLLILVENAGQLVTKEKLLGEIWQDSFVEEGNLNSTVSRLRKILGERPDENRFIETIPRVGYRFVAGVEPADAGYEAPPAPVFLTDELEQPDFEKRNVRWWPVMLAAAALVVAGMGFWAWRYRAATANEAGPVGKNEPVRLTEYGQNEIGPTMTRDGRIRFGRLDGRRPYSYVMNADGSGVARDTSVPGLGFGVWSPDGRHVVFYKENDDSGSLYVADSDGSNEVRLPPAAGNFSWSADSTKFVYQSGRPNADIFLYSLETGKAEPVVTSPSFDADPSLSPDGSTVAFVSDRDGNFEIYTQRIDGSELRRLTDHPAHDSFPTFSPDGTEIAFNSDREGENLDVYLMNADGGRVRKLTRWPSNETTAPGGWSPDGTKLLILSDRSGRDNVYAVGVEPYPVEPLLADRSANYSSPQLSPDGRSLLFQARPGDGAGELRVMDLETRRTTTVAVIGGADAHPRFSPDGTRIVFQDRIDGNSEICVVDTDGSGAVRNLTQSPARDMAPAWSPDGAKIVFSSNRDGSFELSQLYVMGSDGGDPHRIYQSGAISTDPSWSPDGREILFSNDKADDRSGNFEIFAIEPETVSPERRLTFRRRYDVQPALSPDGKRIAFASDADGNMEIYLMNSDGSGLLRLTRDPASDSAPTWSPDGRRIVFNSDRGGRSGIYQLSID